MNAEREKKKTKTTASLGAGASLRGDSLAWAAIAQEIGVTYTVRKEIIWENGLRLSGNAWHRTALTGSASEAPVVRAEKLERNMRRDGRIW